MGRTRGQIDNKKTSDSNKEKNAPNIQNAKYALIRLLTLATIVLLGIFGTWLLLSGDSDKSGNQARDSYYSSDSLNGLQADEITSNDITDESDSSSLRFRNDDLLNSHYKKHGIEMGFSSASEYETAARKVVENSNSLHKIESEDGDDVYYLESTNEFVIVSTDGYIRTYFYPDEGIEYFNRQ